MPAARSGRGATAVERLPHGGEALVGQRAVLARHQVAREQHPSGCHTSVIAATTRATGAG
jgi:hypothetical protein